MKILMDHRHIQSCPYREREILKGKFGEPSLQPPFQWSLLSCNELWLQCLSSENVIGKIASIIQPRDSQVRKQSKEERGYLFLKQGC